MDQYREPDVISEIIKGKLRRLGHVESVTEEINVRRILKNILEEK
jgi:hypothetical protein